MLSQCETAYNFLSTLHGYLLVVQRYIRGGWGRHGNIVAKVSDTLCQAMFELVLTAADAAVSKGSAILTCLELVASPTETTSVVSSHFIPPNKKSATPKRGG